MIMGSKMRLRWAAIAAGCIAAYIVQVIWGLLLGLSLWSSDPRAFTIASAFSVMAGGFVAGSMAGAQGLFNGTMVALPFIAVAALLKSLGELELLAKSGPLALPPMNMGGLIVGDLLLLIAGALGGWLARRP